ncbi:MAG: peptidylprolyl isomerase [Acidimicrobiia bacterium]|nr:peptidylprolyl isomerase [Acidimicrobiia bacterium]
MRILKLVLPLALVCLIAAACSSDSEDSAPAAPTSEATEAPESEPTEVAEGLTATQRELSEAIFTMMLEDAERPAAVTPDQIRCLGDNVASVFSDDRVAELGLSGAQLTAVYADRGSFALGDDYDITDNEITQIVDNALECMDWRTVMAEAIASEGIPADQASCIASEISDEGIRSAVAAALITESEDDLGIAEPEALEAFQACVNVRDMLFQTFVQEGLSEQSARCVADGMPDEVVDLMLGGGEPEDEEAALEMMGELMALQTRCLTPDELELMGASGFQPGGPIPEGSIGTGACPPADGSGPQILDFDGPQPMCLDPWGEYTAVFDTTMGEMRIALDMVNTPVTANNFAVLALHHYYDGTLLFRTDPGIGIIQGGSPHTNSPSDPGPGYTIPDEGTGFNYEPGQIVMARTAAPNSASAQFFFAVNEQTARLNSQGTYVVFGQMDDASLAVAEAILASHVDQPDNPLGGGPEPPVVVNSVTIEETG